MSLEYFEADHMGYGTDSCEPDLAMTYHVMPSADACLSARITAAHVRARSLSDSSNLPTLRIQPLLTITVVGGRAVGLG